jgi:hypothetical protein
MRYITESQLNDISSQAYLLLDFINEDSISVSPRRNNGIKYKKPNIKKSTILNFVAKAYNYSSWSELKITTKNKNNSFSPIYLFNSKADGIDFIKNNLDGIPEVVADLIINILPFKEKLKYPNFPFISQVCLAWGIELNNKTELCFENTNESVFGNGISFEKAGALNLLESVLQKNINTIRNSYFGKDNKSYLNAKKVIIDSLSKEVIKQIIK